TGDFTGTGGYVSGVWNLTGDDWGYKGGVPATPKATEPGKGLWQVGLRYDTLDLDDGAVAGGSIDTLTAGVNWYWQKNLKLWLVYGKLSSGRARVADDLSMIWARVHLHWEQQGASSLRAPGLACHARHPALFVSGAVIVLSSSLKGAATLV